ncbi:MAG: DNA repair protein RecN [Bacilli bacterium]|nr:DNA repair protein RecN [Bacilli bacterium]
MLEQLTIKNFAIIDDLSITFNDGLNIFTGETGAGKSIIIDALGLLTGERASASFVRHGARKAFVEGVFSLTDAQFNRINDVINIDENTLIITKEVDENGKSSNKINGRITTLSNIKLIMHDILDIHSQNDNQYLLDHKYHLGLLDSFGGNELDEVKKTYELSYDAYKNLQKEVRKLENLTIDEDEIEFLKFQIGEIEDANLYEGELEELEEEKRRLSSFEKISEKMKIFMNEYDSNDGVSTRLYSMKKVMDSLSNDPLFEEYSDKFSELYYEIDETYEKITNAFNNIDFSLQRLDEISQRIYQIQKISKKHGKTYEDIMNSYNDMKNKLDSMENIEYELNKARQKLKESYEIVLSNGKLLEDCRRKYGNLLKDSIIKELRDLYLEHCQFDLIYEENENPLRTGLFNVSFYVSMNPGQPLKPLAKIASGGEVSRLMLGLKVICNKLFGVSSTIFDEVDTGVSGKVARAMGLKMLELSKNMQVITITHLPQVASLGNNHYHVEKEFKDDYTRTIVTLLDNDRREIEIAKMISGEEEPSLNAIFNAKELLVG